MQQVDSFPVTEPGKRIEAIMDGIRRAYVGIDNYDMQLATAFAVDYCQTHRYFEGGDMLAAWRKCENIAHRAVATKNWRNKWGAFMPSLKKIGLITAVDRVKPKNIQSHNHSAVLWESNIYVGPEPERACGYSELARLNSLVEAGELPVKNAIWRAYKMGVERQSESV